MMEDHFRLQGKAVHGALSPPLPVTALLGSHRYTRQSMQSPPSSPRMERSLVSTVEQPMRGEMKGESKSPSLPSFMDLMEDDSKGHKLAIPIPARRIAHGGDVTIEIQPTSDMDKRSGSGDTSHPSRNCRNSFVAVMGVTPVARDAPVTYQNTILKDSPRGSYTQIPQDMKDEPSEQTFVEESSWRIRGKELLESIWFQAFMALLIVANAVVLGLETDFPHALPWELLENAFLFAFVAELLLRIMTGGWSFLDSQSPEFFWNIFDFVLLSIGVMDALMSFMFGSKQGTSATVFRTVRLLRVLRVIRIVRFLKQLYLLAFGIALAGVALFWVTSLMAAFLYVCSIVFVRTLGHVSEEDPHYDFLTHQFGTISKAMTTLFELLLSPNLDPFRFIVYEYPIMGAFLIAFIIYGSFGMVAVVTGVITESLFEKNAVKQEERMQNREEERRVLLTQCAQLYDTVDKDESGNCQRADLLKLLPTIKKILESRFAEFPPQDLERMFDIMDVDGSGSIDKREFCQGILFLAEEVGPALMMELHYANVRCMQQCIGNLQELSLEPLMKDVKAIKACVLGDSQHVQSSGDDVKAVVRTHTAASIEDVKAMKACVSENSQRILSLADDMKAIAMIQRQLLDIKEEAVISESLRLLGGQLDEVVKMQHHLKEETSSQMREALADQRQVLQEILQREMSYQTKDAMTNMTEVVANQRLLLKEEMSSEMKFMDDTTAQLKALASAQHEISRVNNLAAFDITAQLKELAAAQHEITQVNNTAAAELRHVMQSLNSTTSELIDSQAHHKQWCTDSSGVASAANFSEHTDAPSGDVAAGSATNLNAAESSKGLGVHLMDPLNRPD